MKLSSITLITATLAAIAGTIAIPVLLHSRALEQVNSFKRVYSREAEIAVAEREVYGEPVDNLSRRNLPHQYQPVVDALETSRDDNNGASVRITTASHLLPLNSKERKDLQDIAKNHQDLASQLQRHADNYSPRNTLRSDTEKNAMVEPDKRLAKNLGDQAKKTTKDAQAIIVNHLQHTRAVINERPRSSANNNSGRQSRWKFLS